jgi:16S rRNA processing protein RimM
MELKVARIGKPHGITGHVTIEPLTDQPENRFQLGANFKLLAPNYIFANKNLTLNYVNLASANILLGFKEIKNREAALEIRNFFLAMEISPADEDYGEDTFHVAALIGLDCVTPNGELIGKLNDVLNLPGQDCLSITKLDGSELLVPFVAQLVPAVSLQERKITISENAIPDASDIRDQGSNQHDQVEP